MKILKKIAAFSFFLAWIAIANYTYLSWMPLFEILGGIIGFELILFILRPLKKYSLYRLINNILLICISIVLLAVLLPAAYLWALIRVYSRYGLKIGTAIMAEYSLQIAHSFDQTGNAVGMWIFSDLFLKSAKGKQFGNLDETVSHVTGVKESEDLLTWLGDEIAWTLNFVDENHTYRAADNPQFNDNIKEFYRKKYGK